VDVTTDSPSTDDTFRQPFAQATACGSPLFGKPGVAVIPFFVVLYESPIKYAQYAA